MRKVWLVWLIWVLAACERESNPISPVPDVVVREQVNLNSAEALPLKIRDGTFIYLNGGIKGIILYRRLPDNYVAFERKSPHRMEDTCGIIRVHSTGLFLTDSCHNCTFNWEGRPTGGPCKDILKQYNVQFLNTFTLLITNP